MWGRRDVRRVRMNELAFAGRFPKGKDVLFERAACALDVGVRPKHSEQLLPRDAGLTGRGEVGEDRQGPTLIDGTARMTLGMIEAQRAKRPQVEHRNPPIDVD